MDHHSYRPGFALRDFVLFVPLKKRAAGQRFATDADVKQALTSCLQTRDTIFLVLWITCLGAVLDRRLIVDGDREEI